MVDEREPAQIEKSLIVPEPQATPEDRFAYTPSQLKVINDRIIGYIKKNRLLLTQSSLQRARGVIGIDAIQRGLQLEGRDVIQPGDNVSKLINTGLQQREDIRERASAVLSPMGNSIAATSLPILGPYGIPTLFAKESQAELARFHLSPSLSSSEEIVQLHADREKVLPELAKVALQSVSHEEFPDATADRFSDPELQAKLVRNMLTSLALQRNASPIISINDLQEMVDNPNLIRLLVQSNPVELMLPYLPEVADIPMAVTEEYIKDLYLQVRFGFHGYLKNRQEELGLSHSEIVYSRDLIYSKLSQTLLLLHPALEERQLIVHIDKANEESYSLWRPDLSVIMKNYRIPNVDALSRAMRLAEAKDLSTYRFGEAINAWRSYGKAVESETRTRARLAHLIKDLSAKIEETANGQRVLSDSDYSYLIKANPDLVAEFATARNRLLYDRRQINSAALVERNQAELQMFLENAKTHPDEDAILPDEIKKIRQKSLRKTEAQRRANLHTTLLLTAYRLQKNSVSFGEPADDTEYWMYMPQDAIDALVHQTIEEKQAFEKGEIKRVPFSLSLQEIEAQVQDHTVSLEERLRPKSGTPQSSGDKERQMHLLSLRQLFIKYVTKNASAEEIQQAYYRYLLVDKMHLTKTVQKARERLNVVNAKLDADEMPIGTNKDVGLFVQQLFAGHITRDQALSEEVQASYVELRSLNVQLAYPNIRMGWVDKIPEPPQFRGWLENRLADEYKRQSNITDKISNLAEGEKSSEADKRSLGLSYERVKILSTILKHFDSPLLPVHESQGLSFDQFQTGLSRRVRKTQAFMSIDDNELEYARIKAIYDETARDVYIAYLEQQLHRAQAEDEMLATTPPSKRRLIQAMLDNKLAMEI